MNPENTESPSTWDEGLSQTFIDYGRYCVPEREGQMRIVVDLLPRLDGSCAVIDLCCGEGLLSEAILERYPEYTVYGLDGSPEMLRRAQERLVRFGSRFRAQRFDLFARSWPVTDEPLIAVVSSLAIHHLDAPQKQALFGEIHGLLAPGGGFIVADMVEPAHPLGWELAAGQWDDAVRERALALDGTLEAFAWFERQRWNSYRYFDPEDIDKPSPLFDQLKWLEQAGFAAVDIYWMRAGHALFGGYKPEAKLSKAETIHQPIDVQFKSSWKGGKMNDERLAPLFGVSIDPSAADPEERFNRARIADENGLDLITIMDHPYNARLFDTWTLMTALAVSTQRVHVGTNVANLPLRPPAMLAKMAATLDVLAGGRVELGIGAGAVWDGIAAYGGPRRTPGQAYQSTVDALHILRGMWENAGGSFTYEGEVYQVRGARPGPAPAHRIRIWVGATGPRMLRLTGRMADGLLISYNYVPPDRLPEINQQIDEGARQAGRPTSDIRRGYNLMGVLDVGREDTAVTGLKSDYISGSVQDWVDKILEWYKQYRQDTFIFWPVAGNQPVQVEAFAKEVVPAVKAELATGTRFL